MVAFGGPVERRPPVDVVLRVYVHAPRQQLLPHREDLVTHCDWELISKSNSICVEFKLRLKISNLRINRRWIFFSSYDIHVSLLINITHLYCYKIVDKLNVLQASPVILSRLRYKK